MDDPIDNVASAWKPARLMRWLLFGIFALSYVGITARRMQVLPLGRPAMALVGAVFMVGVGSWAGDIGLSIDEALAAVERHTLALLLGMMIVAAGLGEAGFFVLAARFLHRFVVGRAQLLWAVTIGSGLLSAAMLNDAVCLLATPLVVRLAHALRAPMRPFLFAVAMGSNAGSSLTLTGNPQNMLVAQLSGLFYAEYFVRAFVPGLLALVVVAAVLHLIFRHEIERVEYQGDESFFPHVDPVLLWASLLCVGALLVANLLGAPLSLTALAAASVVLLAARKRAEALLGQVDWSLLLFFAALFVLVAGLEKTGLPAEALGAMGAPTSGPSSLLVLSGVLLFGSQVVSNVPLILLLSPWLKSFSDPVLTWTTTALVATLAGNLTVLGSVANVIVLERARTQIGFLEYLRVGVPVTLLSTALALAALAVLS